MKRSTQRPALAIGLAASVAVHAAVLAFGAIEVPLASTPEIRLVRPPAPLPAATPEREAPPLVAVIRPPGALPSGGAQGTPGGDVTAPGERPPPIGTEASDAPTATPTPRRAPQALATLAATTPAAETGSPALPLVRDTATASPAARPDRGIILRTGPASTGAGGGRVTGTGGAGGRGGLASGGGVATVGPGGDCITPGIAGREGSVRGPSALPGRAQGPAGRSGRPGGPRRGSGGRGG